LKQVNDHQEECLNILQEECAEVVQAASKIKRFGINNRKEGAELDNLENLEMELGDVLAMIEMCKRAGIGITDEGLERAKQAKFARLGKWMNTTHKEEV
jgi:NTP pyrophosphatase (non-canonical NTP hydrolase)